MSKFAFAAVCVITMGQFGLGKGSITEGFLEPVLYSPFLTGADKDLTRSAVERIGKTLSWMEPSNFLFTKVLPKLSGMTKTPSDGMEGRFFKVVNQGSQTTSLDMLCDVASEAIIDLNDLLLQLADEFEDFVEARIQAAAIAPDLEDQILAAIAAAGTQAAAATNALSGTIGNLLTNLGLGDLLDMLGLGGLLGGAGGLIPPGIIPG